MSKPRIPRGWAKEIKNIEKLSDIADETTITELLSTQIESKQQRKRKAVVLEKSTTPEKPPSPPHPDEVRAMMPPRAILFRKQTAVLSSSGPLYGVGGTSFSQINALLKTRNDARTEAWDSLPTQM
jgi:hypothetical protein